MSTTNLLRQQSAESLAGVGNSPSVYLRKNSQQARQRPEQKEGLDNPGFEGDAVENSRSPCSSPNDGFKRSSSMPQIMDALPQQKPVDSAKRPNEQVSKKRGLLRQRPKTTSGQDLRRKAFINSFKLRRARSGSYLVVPDENYQNVLSNDRGSEFPEPSSGARNEMGTGKPENNDTTRESALTSLYEPVQTKHEDSQLSRRLSASSKQNHQKQPLRTPHRQRNTDTRNIRNSPENYQIKNEYSQYPRELYSVPEQKAQEHETHQRRTRPRSAEIRKDPRIMRNLSESVDITEKENSQLREYSRRLSAALEERAKLTETIYALSRSASPAGGDERRLPKFPQANRPPSAGTKLLLSRGSSFKALPSSTGQGKRRVPATPLNSEQQEGRQRGNADTESGLQAMEERRETAEAEGKKSAVAKLVDELWKGHIPRETLDSNQSSRGGTEDEGMHGQEPGDWENQSDVIRMKQRRAEFRKQTSFQEYEDPSDSLERPGFGLRNPADGQIQRQKETSTRLRKTRTATPNSRQDENHSRECSHPSTGGHCDDSRRREDETRSTRPLHRQPRAPVGERYPRATAEGHVFPHTPGLSVQRPEREKRRGSIAENPRGESDGTGRGSRLQTQILPRDLSGCTLTPLTRKPKYLSSDNADHAGVSNAREGNSSGSLRADSNGDPAQNYKQTNTVPELPAYNFSLMTKRHARDSNGSHGCEGLELADAFMATEDQQERRELQRRAASEAAILRREASNLLWRALDLERICDENARIRHVFLPE